MIYCARRVQSVSRGWRVFLDGEEIEGCFLAYPEAGMVLCYERDTRGNFQTGDRDRGPRVMMYRGAVQVIEPSQTISKDGR